MRLAPLLLFVAAIAGCATSGKYDFDVSVRNATSRPITVGFTKTDQSPERGWAPPEALTDLPPSRQPDRWGTVIPPGKSARYRLTGEFYRGVYALLRVYAGDPPFSDLLAMSRGSGSRIDVMLEPGDRNRYVIDDPDGKLAAHLVRPEPRP